MQLGRVIGTVVATRKDARLEGYKLLVVRLQNADGRDESGYLVAVDTVGAGAGERVLVVQGSSARMARDSQDKPIDAAIVGIVDTVESLGGEFQGHAAVAGAARREAKPATGGGNERPSEGRRAT